MCRRRQIFAARHQSHPLDRVIDSDGEVIARQQVLPGENDIAERSRIRQPPVRPVACLFDPFERAGQRERAIKIEPQRVIVPRTLLLNASTRVETTARPRIWRSR